MAEKSFYQITGLIDAMGGVRSVRQKLETNGFGSYPLETAIGWRRRDSMPGHLALALVEIAMKEGVVSSIEKLRK